MFDERRAKRHGAGTEFKRHGAGTGFVEGRAVRMSEPARIRYT